AGPSRSPAEGSSPDVRVIAATQRNLELLVEHGQFRSDLLERLGGVTLHVPPLRERGGDIVFLARVLARRAAARMSKAEPRFSNDAVAAIEAYQWPGNVRELENAVERAAILADAGEIHAALLAIDASPREPDAGALPVDGEDAVSLEEYFVRFVTEYQDQYTETELASRLGISRKNLWERRKRHGIPRRRTRKRGPRHDPG
ncbi:MAG: sigma-54-dependent Fis family transcriptional regulator, partial [Gammaproteobacteria bacterium]|nr:sigma-54-dependent Fis family transcriptional regulator [Gammaproteobacteria bacterium]